METGKYQFLAIVAVFTFGFFFYDLFSGTENDDIYYQDTAPLLQCTINLDCDNYYEWSMLLRKKRLRIHELIGNFRRVQVHPTCQPEHFAKLAKKERRNGKDNFN